MHEDKLESGTPGGEGELGRRDFLKMALGASLFAVVEGCAPSAPPAAQPTSAPAAPAAPAATTAPAAQPTAAAAAAPKPTAAPAPAKPTGTLTVTVASIGNPAYVPKRIDPTASLMAIGTFAENLLLRNKDLTMSPRVAESWSEDVSKKTLTFNLRRGIKWHDGSDFTSADVKFTLESAIAPDSQNQDLSTWRAALDRIETPTPQQVVFYIKERNISLPWRLAGPGGATNPIFSKSYIERVGENEAAQKPVGTGPWKFVEFKSGELVRYEAVENHWRQTPAFKELVIRQVPEESTAVAMILRGEADLAQVSVGQLKRLRDGGANVFVDPSSYGLIIWLQGLYFPTREKFDPKVPFAADPADKAAWERARKVREAMNIAIDRKAIIDTILGGQAVPATYMYAPPGSAFEDPSWKPYPYDPARAKQLLAETGYPNGFDITLNLVEVPGRPGGPEVSEAVAQFWQAIGIRPKLQKADYTATIRPGIVNRTLPGQAYDWGIYVYQEPVIGHTGMFYGKADTLHGAEYPPLDALVEKAMAGTTFEERRATQLQIGKMVIDEYLAVPIAWVNGLWAGSKRIKTFPRIAGQAGPYNFEYVVPS